MSDKHFDFYSWDEVTNGEPEGEREKRYDQIIEVITRINKQENIYVMTFQEVTEHSKEKLKEYAKSNNYQIYISEIKSVDRQLFLVTMIKDDLVNAQTNNIIDLTPKYQNFYNKNGYNSFKDEYYSGRAQVFHIIDLNLIIVNVHAPGDPKGFTQENFYKGLTSFVRCGCISNQDISDNCYPKNENVKVIFIGDFNVSDPDSILRWSNHQDKKPEFILNFDPAGRNTSYHSGIKDGNVWKPDPNPYQKVDHFMYSKNLVDPINNRISMDVFVSNYLDGPRFLNINSIDNKIIPYSRNPALVMNAAPGAAAPGVGNWQSNFNIDQGGWPSDHTFNLYTFKLNKTLRGGFNNSKKNNKIRKYRIIY